MSDRVSEMREIIDRHAYPALTFTSCEQLHRALIAAGFGDVRAARREALEEAALRAAAALGTPHQAEAAAKAIRALMDRPATDWRALCERLAGALACLNARFEDDLQGRTYTLRDKVNAVTKAREALAAAREAGIGGDHE